MLLYVLHLDDSQEDMLLTSSVLPTYRVSLSKEVFRRARTKKSKCQILYIGVEQDNFLTLEHYINMLAADKKRGGDK